MKQFMYFGVWPNPAGQVGHYLYSVGGQTLRNVADLPCTETPDGVFLSKPEVLYRPSIWWTEGWTIYAMWDRSGDKRAGSNSVFFLPGKVQASSCWDEISKSFPDVAQRISDARMASGNSSQ